MAFSGFSSIEAKITEKPLYDLTLIEWKNVRNHLMAKEVICPVCHEWTRVLFDVPERYKRFISAGNVLFSHFDMGKEVNRACQWCISDAATKKKKIESQEYRIIQGHLEFEFSSEGLPFDFRYKTRAQSSGSGFTYIVKHDELIKIGATTSSVINRLCAYGYSRNAFICAIKSDYPFALERFLHERYRTKKAKIDHRDEIFELCEDDLAYITSIKTINKKPVDYIWNLEELTL